MRLPQPMPLRPPMVFLVPGAPSAAYSLCGLLPHLVENSTSSSVLCSRYLGGPYRVELPRLRK